MKKAAVMYRGGRRRANPDPDNGVGLNCRNGGMYNELSFNQARRPSSQSNSWRTKHRRKTKTKHAQFLVRMALVWIGGVIAIELYFFYSSIGELDRQLHLRGGLALDNIYDGDVVEINGGGSAASEATGAKEGANDGGDETKRPPRPRDPPPAKTSLLPRKIITVVGPESSGTTFLATTLGVAVNAFGEGGGWFHTPAWAYSRNSNGDGAQQRSSNASDATTNGRRRKHRPRHAKGRWLYESEVNRRAASFSDSSNTTVSWEVQHLSLPWGWTCEEADDVRYAQALVPEECFRYESDPTLHPKVAEKRWLRERPGGKTRDATDDEKDDDAGGGGGDAARGETPDEARLRELCRDEVRISQVGDRCGAKCGGGRYDGYALYPRRFVLNITSHIEYYLERGVDVRVVLSVRDGTISRQSKLAGHCHFPDMARREDDAAVAVMGEAMEKYGRNGSRRGALVHDDVTKDRVVVASYEGLMSMQDAYLYELYRDLGIASSYVPKFEDGNRKYLKELSSSDLRADAIAKEVNPPPKQPTSSFDPPPIKASLLPKKIIAVFGTESSGTKFLATTLGVATGAFAKDGQWEPALVPSNAREEWTYHPYNYWRAMSADGEWEVQHLSLPWGGKCTRGERGGKSPVNVVEALVPAECFRYEEEGEWMGDGEKMHVRGALAPQSGHAIADLEEEIAERCRNEAHITHGSASWTCGAKCGEGRQNGFALYPDRYAVNITSHLEWYSSRGVKIVAVLSMRDSSISYKSKFREHCTVTEYAERENQVGLSLMKEALHSHGKLKSINMSKVIPISYEGLMTFQSAYLFGLYKQLGIESTHLPTFDDGNEKYVKKKKTSGGWLERLHKRRRTKPKESLLAKKVVTVFGLESSGTTFLSSVLGVATGIIADGELISRQATSVDGEWELQHLSLPWGWECEKGKETEIVEALVPEECVRYRRDPTMESRVAAELFARRAQHREGLWNPDAPEENLNERKKLLERCREEANISEEDNGWTCGAGCGEGDFNGFALYPQRFFINITSHIEWYLARGVDIKVVLSMRDKTISSRSKLKGHCHLGDVAAEENEVALSIMRDAIEKYGTTRIILVSYEGMMEMEEVYVRRLYHQLGIKSAYMPSFVDGNVKYISNETNLRSDHERQALDDRLESHQLQRKQESILPKRLISVVGSPFLSETLMVAVGNSIETQHLSLPMGSKCNGSETTPQLVEALFPGKSIHPERLFVNITSHIEWYLSRGVDITVILLMRDKSITMKKDTNDNCPNEAVAKNEAKVALEIRKEAYEKYGEFGTLLKTNDKARVVAVSYEGLHELKEAYLFNLYRILGINSTYSPPFVDDNAKYLEAEPVINFWERRYRGHKKGHHLHDEEPAPVHFLPWSSNK